MALRLNERVTGGEIYNIRSKCVHGYLLVHGFEEPIVLELTGDASDDLRGRSFRFSLPANKAVEGEETVDSLGPFQPRQIGATGTIAIRRVKTFDCPPEELIVRAKLGELPPEQWQDCLYLEWFGQNGRVVVELPGIEIEWLDEKEEGDPSAAQPLATEDDEGAESGELPAFLQDEEGDEAWSEEDEESEYDLVPKELLRELESSAVEVDRQIHADEDSQFLQETELMDRIIECKEKGVTIAKLLGEILPDLESVGSEERAEAVLKSALSRLALFGVAFGICEHCSWRDAYRIFLEIVADEGCEVHPELKGTGWVQHFDTHERCPECNREIDEEMGKG